MRLQRVLGILLVSAVTSACAPTDHRVILASLRDQLGQQYHECVPLGWDPVPASGSYYPGANVELQEGAVWLPALWLAWIDEHNLRRADVRATAELLDALTRIGMLEKRGGPRGALYRLTPRAVPYYFAESRHGNNPEAISYLCYSTIVPQRVVWNDAIHPARVGARDAQVFQAAFEWTAGPAAAWASDPIVRSHSVVLSPTRSPSIATFVQNGSDWTVSKLGPAEPPLGRIVDTSVWPRPKL